MLHNKALYVVTSYGMYLDYAEENLEYVWKVEITMTFWEFGDKFLKHMLIYNTSRLLYPDYDHMRMTVVQNKYHRRKRGRPSAYIAEKGKITKPELGSAIRTRYKVGRLCGGMENFQKYIDLVA